MMAWFMGKSDIDNYIEYDNNSYMIIKINIRKYDTK